MSQYANYIKTRNPYLFWEMQETSGTAVLDSSGAGNPGYHVVSGGTINLGQPGNIEGGKSIYIAGNSRLEVTPINVAPFTSGGQGTLEVWFKLDSFPTNWGRIAIVGIDTVSLQALSLTRFSNTSRLNIGTPSCDQDTGYTIDTGWHHLAVVLDNNLAKFYADGVYYAQTTCVPSAPAAVVRVGGGISSEHLNGYYSHFTLYDRVVPEAELLDHYQYGAGIKSFYHVTGTVRVTGQPAVRAVHVLNRTSGELMGTGFSDTNGFYDIDVNTNDETCVVILEDPTSNRVQSVVRDHVIPADKPV